jgi:hypothetical protein
MANTFKVYQSSSVTTEDVVYTCPVSTATTLIGLTVANTSGVDTLVSVKVNSTFVVKNALVTEGSAIVPIGGEQKVVVEAGGTVSVIADNIVDVTCSVLEIS